MENKPYGFELILDLNNCDPERFSRESIEKYFIDLCELIGMVRCDMYFWDYLGEEEEYKKAPDHLKGTSAIQFITTSNITIHTLDILKKVFINIFSCKDFDVCQAKVFTKNYFNGRIIKSQMLVRG